MFSYSEATMRRRPWRPPFVSTCSSGDAATCDPNETIGARVERRAGDAHGPCTRGILLPFFISLPRPADEWRTYELHGVEVRVEEFDDVNAELLHPILAGEAEVARAVVEHPEDVLRLRWRETGRGAEGVPRGGSRWPGGAKKRV